MKYFKQLSIIAIISVALLGACKDDDESPTESKEKLLAGETSKDWKVSGILGSSNEFKGVSIDLYSNKVYVGGLEVPAEQFGLDELPEFPECAKDDIITFKSDKTYTVSEGNSLCTGTSMFELSSGKWELIDNGDTLKLTTSSGQEIHYKLVEITENSIVGENEAAFSMDGQNINVIIKTTFTAQ
jgi:hypothetical protein